jgi:nicotinate-nucleotide--dimethylbenzimidazole phosphoribosyltransferase
MSKVEKALKSIEQVDTSLIGVARQRLDSLTKPPGSLGRLEEFAERIVAITGNAKPEMTGKTIFTFAGDHGVADEGVSAFPREVTSQMVLNFLNGGAGINVLARHAGVDVVVVDIGVDYDFDDLSVPVTGLERRKVMRGTRNMRKGPAMSREEAISCFEVGIALAEEYVKAGSIFGTGDMGIGNSTPSSAIIAVFSGLPVEEVTGRGTGIDERSFRHKVNVIEDALKITEPG